MDHDVLFILGVELKYSKGYLSSKIEDLKPPSSLRRYTLYITPDEGLDYQRIYLSTGEDVHMRGPAVSVEDGKDLTKLLSSTGTFTNIKDVESMLPGLTVKGNATKCFIIGADSDYQVVELKDYIKHENVYKPRQGLAVMMMIHTSGRETYRTESSSSSDEDSPIKVQKINRPRVMTKMLHNTSGRGNYSSSDDDSSIKVQNDRNIYSTGKISKMLHNTSGRTSESVVRGTNPSKSRTVTRSKYASSINRKTKSEDSSD